MRDVNILWKKCGIISDVVWNCNDREHKHDQIGEHFKSSKNNEIEKRWNYLPVRLICLAESGYWIFLHMWVPNFELQTWVWKGKTTVTEEYIYIYIYIFFFF